MSPALHGEAGTGGLSEIWKSGAPLVPPVGARGAHFMEVRHGYVR